MWEPSTGKTVAGNAAPYRRNLIAWLHVHPGWEEKADELKSSKRRSAARRSRIAAQAFAAICCYPEASFLASDAARYLATIDDKPSVDVSDRVQWSMEDFVRLQEHLARLAQFAHKTSCESDLLDARRWQEITRELGEPKDETTVVSCALHMLTRGIDKSRKEVSIIRSTLSPKFGDIVEHNVSPPSLVGSPTSPGLINDGTNAPLPGSGTAFSAPPLGAAAALERSFRAPREPRVTVWNPANGRTISGNAAPCRRNLEAWMLAHPGWLPKEEGQLSSSRRNRNRKVRPASVPISTKPAPVATLAEVESPHFHDAIEGLLVLARSPHACSATLNMMRGVNQRDSHMSERSDGFGNIRNGGVAELTGNTSRSGKGDDSEMDDIEEGGGDGDDDANGSVQNGNFVMVSSVSCSSLENENGGAMTDDEGNEADDGPGSDMDI